MPTPNIEISQYSGADYEYAYIQLNRLDEQVVERYCGSLRERLRKMSLTPEQSEIWIVRAYVAVKYLLAASLLLVSAEFASKCNLKIVQPYLLYYALFNTSHALFLMVPEQEWRAGAILDDVTHQKAQNVVADYLRYLSPEMAQQFKDVSGRAMATREMLSYKFPALGLTGGLAEVMPDFEDVVDVCQFLAEAAQLNSECIQAAFAGVPDGPLSPDSPILKRFYIYEHKSIPGFGDSDDWYRLWQFGRHSNKPLSLHLTARAGLVEDFIGVWCPDGDETPDHLQFDPDDADMRLIFDFH
jgi:hypothetical protein